MDLKIIRMIIMVLSSFFSLNSFAYLYGVKVTINNNTDSKLIIWLEGDNNINKYQPFFYEKREFPETSRNFYLEPNSKSVFYLDNYDWSGWLYRYKVTNYSIIKKLENEENVVISTGRIFIVTGATMWHMYGYFDKQKSIKLPKYSNFYLVKETPDYDNSKFDTAGNTADLNIDIEYNDSYICDLIYKHLFDEKYREDLVLLDKVDESEKIISQCH